MILIPARNRVLVPLELPDPDEIPGAMRDFLAGVEVLLLGWYQTPEQTPPEQAREEAEDTGAEALEAEAERLREAGATVETHHVFTPELMATVQRIGMEEACDAALLAGPVTALERILVLVREGVSPGSLASLLSDLSQDRERSVTLLHLASPEEESEEGEEGRMARVREALEAEGLDPERLEYRVERAEDSSEAAVTAASEGGYDLVLVPERGELEEQMFGSFAEEVAAQADLPVLILRVPGEQDD